MKLDPSYALAWAGLSIAYAHGTGQGWLGTDFDEGFRLASEGAGKAMQLAPDLAESHEALGVIRYAHEWDWKGAEASFAQALKLAPHSIRIMRNAVFVLNARGRFDEAIALLRHAVELDPLSGAVHCFLARSYQVVGRLDEAETAIRKSLELNPHGGFAHYYHSDICLAQGRLDEALTAAKREINDIFRLLALANVYHTQGRYAKSNEALKELIESNPDTAALQIAQAFGHRGERDQAFSWLDRACAQRDPGMSMIRALPTLRGLHDDPRWGLFVRKVGLGD